MLHDLDKRKFLFRLMFVGMPAICIGLLLCLVHPYFGLLGFAGVSLFGWDITKVHPERGEH